MFWLNFEENKECLAACNFCKQGSMPQPTRHLDLALLAKAQIFLKENRFWPQCSYLPAEETRFCGCICTPVKIITQIIGWEYFYVMARASCNKFYVIRPRSLPLSFSYVMADPCTTHKNVVLQVWLLDARWTIWELCIEAKNNVRAFSMCKMFWGGLRPS